MSAALVAMRLLPLLFLTSCAWAYYRPVETPLTEAELEEQEILFDYHLELIKERADYARAFRGTKEELEADPVYQHLCGEIERVSARLMTNRSTPATRYDDLMADPRFHRWATENGYDTSSVDGRARALRHLVQDADQLRQETLREANAPKNVRLVLQNGDVVSGRVLDAKPGDPAGSIRVRSSRGDELFLADEIESMETQPAR